MKQKRSILSDSYLFVFLLPVFFVLHGWNEYLFFVPASAALKLLFTYALSAIITGLIFFWLYRNKNKALLAVFVSFLFYFFFGWVHDVLKSVAPGTVFTKYSFLLPFLSILYIFLLIRIKGPSLRPSFIFYLNALFILLLLIDIGDISYKLVTKKATALPAVCNTCSKPDVHLIILDGYAGREQLEKDFGDQDSSFFKRLGEMGFHVIPNSRSNYPATALSVSSLLNMEYHQLKNLEITDEVLNYCYRQIADNKVTATFKSNGYEFVNNSIFDISGSPSLSEKTFLVSGADLIASQTLSARLRRDLYQNFIRNYFPDSRWAKKLMFADKKNNELLYDRLKKIAGEKHENPVFSYTHLMMPHFPYYYKETGQLNEVKDLLPSNVNRKDLYLSYLKYTNNKIAELCADVLSHDKQNTVIVLVSDHGFRYSGNTELYYSTLGAVYRPDKNYNSYNDSLSNVNQFRILFNDLFKTGLQPLKNEIVR